MQILQLLQRLTNALGPSCVVMQSFVVGVLDYSLNIEGPEALSLVEDALLLWLVTLRNVAADSRAALSLWPHWVKIMGTSIEHVQSCMMVASSAVLLGQAEFLQVRRRPHTPLLPHPLRSCPFLVASVYKFVPDACFVPLS